MKTCNNCKHLLLQPRCKVLNRELEVKGVSACDERYWYGVEPTPFIKDDYGRIHRVKKEEE